MALMSKKGITQEQIDDLHRDRMEKQRKKEKEVGCWDCGSKLTTRDHPIGISHLGTNPKLGVARKKVAGHGYLCFTCYSDAKKSSDEIDELGVCFFCGDSGGRRRNCGVHLCVPCITDIKSHGDGKLVENENIKMVAGWWFTGRGLLSCLMELETFQRTENVKRLKELREEIAVERKVDLITEENHENILSLIDDIIAEVGKDDGEPVEMAAGLYGVIEGLLMKVLYHEHPLKKAESIQLEPGRYDLHGLTEDGSKEYQLGFEVKAGNAVLDKVPKETTEDKEAGDEEPAAED